LVFSGSKTICSTGQISPAFKARALVGSGARAIVLTNQKGAVLELSGEQFGLTANADKRNVAP